MMFVFRRSPRDAGGPPTVARIRCSFGPITRILPIHGSNRQSVAVFRDRQTIILDTHVRSIYVHRAGRAPPGRPSPRASRARVLRVARSNGLRGKEEERTMRTWSRCL